MKSRSMPNDRTDDLLLDRVRAGDGDALRRLYDRHAQSLHRLACRLLASRDDADDVVQDVFVGLRTALARYTEHGTFEHWLRRVTARTALMRLRAEGRRQTRAMRALPELDVDRAQSDPALRDVIARAIDDLPPSLRVVFILRMMEGYSHEDIAAAVGISVSACKVRLHRALRALRPQLEHLREESWS